MSSNGRAMAEITVTEWDDHVRLEGRILGDHGRLANAVTTLTNEVARLTSVCDRLERGLRKAERRVESFEDLNEEAKMASLIYENKRLRGLPARIFKYVGWAVGLGVGIVELWKAFH
jgi:hypothetical protein